MCDLGLRSFAKKILISGEKMYQKSAGYRLSILLCVLIAVFCLFPLSGSAGPTAPSFKWVETFDELDLNSRWSWVREDPTHWSLSVNPGFMHIITQPGGLLAGDNNAQNLLLSPAPPGDFVITTRVKIEPTENFQGAAIFVYQDDDNYLTVTRRYGNGQVVTFREEVNAVSSSFSTPETATDLYLRITRVGGVYEGMYSLDANLWVLLGSFSPNFVNPQIGIGSQSGTSLNEIPTDYYDFQLDSYANCLYLPVIGKP
jgi:regulation of enolase protein 1 (concanavalin A-like superfamily)